MAQMNHKVGTIGQRKYGLFENSLVRGGSLSMGMAKALRRQMGVAFKILDKMGRVFERQ